MGPEKEKVLIKWSSEVLKLAMFGTCGCLGTLALVVRGDSDTGRLAERSPHDELGLRDDGARGGCACIAADLGLGGKGGILDVMGFRAGSGETPLGAGMLSERIDVFGCACRLRALVSIFLISSRTLLISSTADRKSVV